MKVKSFNSTKQIVLLLLAIAMLFTSTFIASANTNRKTNRIDGNNVVSQAYTGTHKVSISSAAGANTGSVRGTHTITYRAEIKAGTGLNVYQASESFGGAGGMIIKNNLHVVDYAKGKHIYKFTGAGTFIVNTKAHN